MRRSLLFWGDILIFYISLVITLILRYGVGQIGFYLPIHFLPFTILLIVWILVYYITNLYDIYFAKNNLEFYTAFISSFIFNAIVSVIFFYVFSVFQIAPKRNLFIFIVVVFLLQTFWRFYFNRRAAKDNTGNNTLIIGLSQQSQELYDYLLANPQLGYNALGIIDVQHDIAPDILEGIIQQKKIRILVLGPEAYKVPKIIDILYKLVIFKMSFYNLSDFFEKVTGKVPLDVIDQAWFLANLSEGTKRAYEVGKKVIDIIFAFIIGIISLPFYPFIVWAIKLDSPGGVFYRQSRVGRGGKIFTLIKFRTMRQDSEAGGPKWATENDSRTTKVGKILRRLRFDETPQIWNVIRGNMSFVGPRPERPEFHDKLKKEVPFYEERYLIKPGLTGWAQIKFKLDFRGGLTTKDTYEKVQYDLYYIKNRSLLLDIGIILKTINIVLKKLFQKSKALIYD